MRYSARPSTAEGHYYRLLCSNITIPRCCSGLRNSHRRSSSSRYAGMSPANCMRRTGPPTLIRERGYTRPFAGRCGRRYALPVDQRLKLLGNLHIQLDDAFIAVALAAIPASDRKETIFLGVVEDREQLAFGIDQHGHGSVLWKRPSRKNCSTLSLDVTSAVVARSRSNASLCRFSGDQTARSRNT